MHDLGGLVADDNVFQQLMLREPATRKLLSQRQEKREKYYVSETREDRKSSAMYEIRLFHNDVKTALYVAAYNLLRPAEDGADEHVIAMALDLGAGRGGDIAKYRKAQVRTVYAVDNDKKGLEELAERHRESGGDGFPRNIETIHADMSRLLSDGSAGLAELDKRKLVDDIYRRYSLFCFPLLSCQFAMHFAFGTEAGMLGFMLNVYQSLEIGGFFIGTILDGDAARQVLRASGGRAEFANDKGAFAVFEQKEAGAKTVKQFGQAIDVTISSIAGTNTEYLVDFDGFAKTMAEKFDVALVSDDAARSAGLPGATGLFDAATGLRRGGAELSKTDMAYSRLHRWFLMTKVGPGNAAAVAAALKLVSKA
jgi:mRNA (guanine-N7-)-methyltransferase